MYNKVSQTGRQPIFQCVHKNLQLPLVINNFDCRECSVLGISKVVQEVTGSKDNDKKEPMGIEYAMPSLLERFDSRWDSTVSHARNIKNADFRQEMSLKEFCDKFTSRWATGGDEASSHLHLSERRDCTETFYYPIRLKPHLTKKANPTSATYWLYCKYLCLWLAPCKRLADLLPTEENLSEDQLQDYWKSKYNDTFCEEEFPDKLLPDNMLPKSARAYHEKYHKHNDSESDKEEKEEDVLNDSTEAEPSYTEMNIDDDSNEEDMDVNLRETRAENSFYQNPDDQLHLRDTDDNIESVEQHCNLTELSNPGGVNFI